MTNGNPAELLDQRPLSRLQITVWVLCVLVAMMDGFDTQAIGYVAPAIVQAWGISKLALGPVFSAGLVGSLLGALIFGPSADRFGRKPVLIVCASIFGLAALATANAESTLVLLGLRFVTGLGMGGAMPIAIAQTSEFMPRRIRGFAMTLTYCGFSAGAALGGLAADQLIQRFSWQSVFIAGSVPTLVLVFCMVFWLPESISFLLSHDDTRGRAKIILGKLGLNPSEIRYSAWRSDKLALTTAVGRLFTDGRAPITAAIWLIVFMNLVELYFFTSWLPTVIHGVGISIGLAALVTALFQVGGTLGALAIGRLIDIFRKFRVMCCVFFSAAVFVTSVGYLLSHTDSSWAFVSIACAVTLAGVCVVGGQIGIIAVTATIYPTEIRSAGVGWALGIGRIGSVVGPFIGSALIAGQLPIFELFLIGAVPVVIAGSTSLWLDAFTLRMAQATAPQPDTTSLAVR
jgi:AAHS family 4-hydroxybenzoate transporter-like MFS transporter